MDHEEWRAIPDWEEWYSASSFGRIRRDMAASGATVNQIIKPCFSNGYLHVGLHRNNYQCTVRVHKLIAITFIGPRPTGLTINHIDGNKTNNHIANLEYVTQQRQIQHAFEIGLISQVGEHNNGSKLTDDVVIKARTEYANGLVSQRELSVRYGVSLSVMRRALRGKTWKHLDAAVHGGQPWRTIGKGRGSKLTIKQTDEIKLLSIRDKLSSRKIALIFGVSHNTILDIINGIGSNLYRRDR